MLRCLVSILAVFVCFFSPLGGSWVVISGAISRVNILITHIRGSITLLVTTHEPPSLDTGQTGKKEDGSEKPSPRTAVGTKLSRAPAGHRKFKPVMKFVS